MLLSRNLVFRALSRKCGTHSYATAANAVNIVEVGPRDGLQNEKGVIPVSVKAELVTRLGRAGVKIIEAGSFVSPKWVPQMAGTADVLAQAERFPDVRYPVLVPNQKGLDAVTTLLAKHPASPPLTDEISIFTAATDAFTRANLNTTTAESLERLAPVAKAALDQGLRVRGYVSVVIACPYSGQVDYARVRDIAKALIDMGCYEVSLGDTVGMGTPTQVSEMLEEVKKSIPVEKLAGHPWITAFAPSTLPSAGLGGCPYSPGATGNVATEDVLYALQGSQYHVAGTAHGNGTIDLDKMVDIGWWISEQLGRESTSRAGRAIRARRLQEREREVKAKL
ncbi:hypothetical protein MVEN_01804800 [Mycena venus]|uniref:hydroxymethylglutaryl-CoA lyase n=1 Tax=Mycena venus TaxID=2733690 RepID=A0A8H6XKV5_9AGAR|nr:hypothetical protein MVEN_01804800 [Mycena venus]